jgi:hypothetical protein
MPKYSDILKVYTLAKRLSDAKISSHIEVPLLLVEGLRDYTGWPAEDWTMVDLTTHGSDIGKWFRPNPRDPSVVLCETTLRIQGQSINMPWILSPNDDGSWEVRLFGANEPIRLSGRDEASLARFFEQASQLILEHAKETARA